MRYHAAFCETAAGSMQCSVLPLPAAAVALSIIQVLWDALCSAGGTMNPSMNGGNICASIAYEVRLALPGFMQIRNKGDSPM